MQEFDPSHYAGADRREANPPIEVESATWSAAGQLDWWLYDPFLQSQIDASAISRQQLATQTKAFSSFL